MSNEYEFLDYSGVLSLIAGINQRVKAVADLPSVPTDLRQVVLNLNTSSPTLIKGHIYKSYIASYPRNWLPIQWQDYAPENGIDVWTDGTDTYYSRSSTNQFVFDPDLRVWLPVSWGTYRPSNGRNVWTDGTDIYYSDSSSQYILDKTAHAWSVMPWSGFTPVEGRNVWTDGDNIYYSTTGVQKVLNKETHTWSDTTWSGTPYLYGEEVWTDGTSIYFSPMADPIQKVLNKETQTWSDMTWSGDTSQPRASNIWTDGTNIYYSNGSDYLLDKENHSWSLVTFTGGSVPGHGVWQAGNDIYATVSSGGTVSQYVLDKVLAWEDITPVGASPVLYEQTLAANETTVTFTGLPTSGDYTIDFYTSDGSNYTGIDLSVPGTAVLTFEAKAIARQVSCKVQGV